jgi:hypothetical protein
MEFETFPFIFSCRDNSSRSEESFEHFPREVFHFGRKHFHENNVAEREKRSIFDERLIKFHTLTCFIKVS